MQSNRLPRSNGIRLTSAFDNATLNAARGAVPIRVVAAIGLLAGLLAVAALPVATDASAALRVLMDDEGYPQALVAAAIPDDVQSQTHHGLYLTARDAYETKNWLGRAILFIDVRDTEYMPTGAAPDNVDFNLPVTHHRAAGKPQVAYGFVGTIKRTLAARGLDHDAPVMVICENGRNAALAAELLAQAGVPNVFVVRGGMQGEIGAIANSTGWLSAGLPVTNASSGPLTSKSVTAR